MGFKNNNNNNTNNNKQISLYSAIRSGSVFLIRGKRESPEKKKNIFSIDLDRCADICSPDKCPQDNCSLDE